MLNNKIFYSKKTNKIKFKNGRTSILKPLTKYSPQFILTFYKNLAIFKLRKEREEVAKDLLLDKKNLNDLETNMRKVKMELEYRKSTLREKE